jgi:N-acetylglucosamine malate deacetylase 1
MKSDKVLVLSPHTDDAELGAGGTIARFVEECKEVRILVFSRCEDSVPKGLSKDVLEKECVNSVKCMGIPQSNLTILNYKVRTFPEHRQAILDDIIQYKRTFSPDLILVPSSEDTHQDHGVIRWEALRSFKKEASIWGYEHPWNNLSFTTDIFVRLNKKHLEKKLQCLGEYKSQLVHRYMEKKNITALLVARGAQLDIPYAEAFELIRLII